MKKCYRDRLRNYIVFNNTRNDFIWAEINTCSFIRYHHCKLSSSDSITWINNWIVWINKFADWFEFDIRSTMQCVSIQPAKTCIKCVKACYDRQIQTSVLRSKTADLWSSYNRRIERYRIPELKLKLNLDSNWFFTNADSSFAEI